MKTIALLGAALAAACFLSLLVGHVPMTAGDVVLALAGRGDARQDLIVLDLRLPRLLLGVLAGAGLAVAGAILQAVSRNPLAEAGTLGITGGAGTGMMMLLLFYPLAVTQRPALLPVAAFAGAAYAIALTYVLAAGRGRLQPSRLLLVGVSVGLALNAATLLLPLRMSYEIYNYALDWLTGTLVGAEPSQLLVLTLCLAALLPPILLRARTLDVLELGDDSAAALGLDLRNARLRWLGLASALAAGCVAMAGGIAFVGLMAPHAARKLAGPRHAALLPASALCGAILMAAADGAARSLPGRVELSTGTVVGVLGGAYFLLQLLLPARRSATA